MEGRMVTVFESYVWDAVVVGEVSMADKLDLWYVGDRVEVAG